MARGRKTMGAYKQTPMNRVAKLMGETAVGKPEDVGHMRWMREFGGRGIIRWEMFQEICQPYISGIKTDPTLTPEMKAIAVKEFFRRVFGEERGLESFFMGVMGACKEFSRTLVPMPIVRRSRY